MDKVLTYKIIPEFKLIIEYASGEIHLSDIIEMKQLQTAEEGYDRNFNFIIDARDSIPVFSEEEIKQYVEFIKNSSSVSGNRNSAWLINPMAQIVETVLYKEFSKNTPMNIVIVTSPKEAFEWVGIAPGNFQVVEELMEGMRVQ